MPQLHMYVPKEVAAKIRRRAQSEGVTVSQVLAQIVAREFSSEWPEGYWERVSGGWEGEPLVRPDQGEYEVRKEMFSETTPTELAPVA